jgi:hypothetical protein
VGRAGSLISFRAAEALDIRIIGQSDDFSHSRHVYAMMADSPENQLVFDSR